MSISSLHFNCLTCSKLVTSPNSITLYTVSITSNHSHILSISPMTINLQIPSGTQLSHSAPNFVSSFHKFVLISISNNIWDPLKLLLLSCDVQTNLGLQPIDKNSVLLHMIFKNQSRDSTKYGTCSNSNCNRRVQRVQTPAVIDCHLSCNGQSTYQTHHRKTCGRTITWKCPQHTPPPPVFEFPSRPSAAGKLCSVCNNPICLCYANQAYHCEDLSYNDVCHLNATCSGFVNHIGTTRACLLSTRIWLCHLHSSPTANGNSSTQPDTFSWCPTPLSLNSPLNKGMSLADAKNSK